MMRYTRAIVLIVLSTDRSAFSLTLTSGERITSRRINSRRINHKAETPGRTSFLDLPAIEQWGTENGLKEHHLKSLYRVIMHSPNCNFEEQLQALSFPKTQISTLLSEFDFTCSIHKVQKSIGGAKFVIQLPNGKLVESVLIRHERQNGHVRYTVCVSSQIGCAKKCSFCATGTMGLIGQLSSAEILEQIYLVQQYVRQGNMSGEVNNVVFMGMGEPLDNYDAVHEALRGITHQCLFGLQAKKVTVSTVGASAQKIRALADEAPQVSLALSLHSAIQSSREVLIPSAVSSPIHVLGDALDYHSNISRRGTMLEYLLIDGVNDSDDEADALADFCLQREGIPFVNLIPYNPTLAGDNFGYQTPSDGRINAFHAKLKQSGVKTIVRWSTKNGRDANGTHTPRDLTFTTSKCFADS